MASAPRKRHDEKVSWSVAEFAHLTGIPRSTVYELIHAGRVNAKRVNVNPTQRSRYLITTRPEEFTEGLADA